jgi:hypothetical protein
MAVLKNICNLETREEALFHQRQAFSTPVFLQFNSLTLLWYPTELVLFFQEIVIFDPALLDLEVAIAKNVVYFLCL